MKFPMTRRTFLTRSSQALVGAGLTGTLLEACGGSSGGSSSSSGPVTLTYGWWSNGPTKDNSMLAWVKEFESAHPNIKVKPEILPWANYWSKLQTTVAGGNAYEAGGQAAPYYDQGGTIRSQHPCRLSRFRQFFIDLPRELDEAARLDGCSNLRIWWNVILPQSRPVLIVVAIFTFLSSWRDAWNPLIYLSSQSNRTIPLGLLYFSNGYTTVYPQMMAATVVALAVPVILYAIGQRYIDSGVAIAEIK
jgi:hypothetical protein